MKIKNIGLVSYWFNRGQGTVSRYIRSIFDQLGYATFVLARPTKERFSRPSFVASNDVWNQQRVSEASNFLIPEEEYIRWVEENDIEVVFFDQNYQFDAIGELRRKGVVTIGRFVWESFAEHHVLPASNAFDVIYSLTRCEQERYRGLGIESPHLRWGVHPELLPYRDKERRGPFTFFYPGGYLSPRKPTGAVVEAFSRVARPDVRLILKTQKKLEPRELIVPETRDDTRKKFIRNDDPVLVNRYRLLSDPRIRVVTGDLDAEDYYALFSSCHVCLAPSRWEGLGLHFFEAIGFGLPVIANDIPPVNEFVLDGETGLLVGSTSIGNTKSGIQAFEPSISDLTKAMETMMNRERYDAMKNGIFRASARFLWDQTVEDYHRLLLDATARKKRERLR